MSLEKKFNNVKIGADPEFFVERFGNPYPIVGILGGDKYAPKLCEDIGPECGFLEDNVMAEYNIPPCTSADDFVHYNLSMIERIMETLPKELELTPIFQPSVRFNPAFLDTEQAQEFGCMPDHNAYTMEIQQPNAADAQNLRTAGGHIHIGWDQKFEDEEKAATVARAFDLFVTMPFMLIEPDNERRQLYGKAGSMRVKWYGVECRQLSCFWLSDEKWIRWVFNQTMQAVEFCEVNEDIWNPDSEMCKEVRTIIDEKRYNRIIPTLNKYGITVSDLETV